MEKVIGVQFQKNGKLYYFDSNGFETVPGQYVIVDTSRGADLGEVVVCTACPEEEQSQTPLKKTIRIATEQDIQHSVENRQKEKEAFSVCQRKIQEHRLEMKLVSVEYAFDNSKIMFFFTANGRVDFRSLVKDLASVFKMRIELRQIGVRDEAKMLGGLGPCGRPICCGAFLDQFQPVSIKMAKEQNLSLNPTKISGVCGRLMCCLKYEQEHYEMMRKKMPRVGKEVITPDGNGPVTDLNIVKETVFVRLSNGDSSEIKEYPLDQITRPEPSVRAEARRNPVNESESPAEASPSEAQQVVSEPETPAVNPPAPEKKKQEPIQRTPNDRNRTRTRKGTLGQPVRRENHNRSQEKQPKKPVPEQKAEAAEPQAASSRQQSPWTDALEKAIQAINQD